MNTIELNLPQGWNYLTTAQLEDVSRIFIDESKKFTESGTFNRVSLLVRCFFSLSGLRVISLPHIENKDTEEDFLLPFDNVDPSSVYYNCEYVDERRRSKIQMVNGSIIPIRVYLNEILEMSVGKYSSKDIDLYLKKCERYERRKAAGKVADEPTIPEPIGPLSWLMKSCNLEVFPYPEIVLEEKNRRKKERWINPDTMEVETRNSLPTVTMYGPAELMQDFKWRQYRFASDFINYISKCENILYDLQKKKAAKSRIERQQRIVDDLRAQWLATLFSRDVVHKDLDTDQLVYSPCFVTSQCNDNAYLFKSFPEEKYQSILFWWQGMMLYLQKRYPKVFTVSKVGKADREDDPLALYTRSTTTMIKYAAANEEEVNNTSYTIILQHMQDMAEENERIEKMKSK